MSRVTQKKRYAFSMILTCTLLIVLAGCLVPLSEEQGETMYYHNWWNYYERAVYRMCQGRIDAASKDFERCLGLRSGAKFGNSQDMWRARTYGLHFLEGYFPNRELGICHYEKNNITQAVSYLEISLRQEPSGRAKHYLNLARGKLYSGQPVPPPAFRFDTDIDTLLTSERSIELSGSVAGRACIRCLSVGGQSEFIELAPPSMSFKRMLTLSPGTNVIAITAEDLLGQSVTQLVVRVADRQPPRLLVRRLSRVGGDWLIEGVCRDEYGLAEVTGGSAQIYRAGGDADAVEFEVPVALRLTGSGIKFRAVDCAGNVLVCPLNAEMLQSDAVLSDLATLPVPVVGFAGHLALAAGAGYCRWLSVPKSDNLVNGLLSPELIFGGVHMSSFVVAAVTASPQVAQSDDRLRPSLLLKDCQPLTRVYAEDFFLDGRASDGGGLASVTINGETLLQVGDEGALSAYFMRHISLESGTNEFEVIATDLAGNRSVRELKVVRLRPEYQDDAMRLSVGVPPLTPADTGYVGVRIKRSMEMELTRPPVRFRLLERSEGWDFVLREQGLSLSDLADPSAALRIGKMVPAEMLLMGRIYTESKGITIYVKVVDTSEGVILFASDVYTPDPDRVLDEVVSGLVLKVQQGFPLISGKVFKHQGATVTLNVGRDDGVTKNSRFFVIKAQNKADLVYGQVCRQSEKPVQLQIVTVGQDHSTARIIPSEAEKIVKEGYYVYTR
jgi:hypothetical protein